MLASLLAWFIGYMKLKKAWAKWLLGLVFIVSIVYVVFGPRDDKTGGTQTASTSGSNSPATIQTATTTGSNSPIIQAAAGATVNASITYGVSEETMRRLLIDEDNNSRTELAERYPQGYALLGYASGSIVFEPRLKNITVNADWNNTKVSLWGGSYVVHLSSFQIERPGYAIFRFDGIDLVFSSVPNSPTREPLFGFFIAKPWMPKMEYFS